MAHGLSQAKVTEMSIMAMQTGSTSTMQREGFYNIILAHAKLQDHSKSSTSTKVQINVHEQGRGSGRSSRRVRGAGTGRGGRTGCGTAATTASPDLIFTTFSGPAMTMKANMKFQPEEWAKLTPAQKSQLCAAKGLTSLPTSPREANITTVTPIATHVDSVSVVAAVTSDSLLRQTLSNMAARTPSDSVNQLNYNGSTYQRIANHVNICYHVQSASRQNQ
jgi:hypothetical protein